jgi:hypothetical protein
VLKGHSHPISSVRYSFECRLHGHVHGQVLADILCVVSLIASCVCVVGA